ncbi:MAG: hypothetical protein KJ808_00985 [Acidobacteria bacterium]|nr:hypothetical protein [Acidobacteriota bacterium]MCG2812566.1 hypothetical protein [Candidatus Aminicenantes bacterium]
MKKIFVIAVVAGMILAANTVFAQGTVDQIIIYKVADPNTLSATLTGTGMNGFKLTVGEEIYVMAKGVDVDGKEVAIWPTWKAEKELSLSVVEGKSKVAKIKALQKGAPLFFSAVYIDDAGKKHKGEVMGEVKEPAK